VALSCGGTVHKLSQAGKKVLVLTVFSSPSDLPLSNFAKILHKEMGAVEGLTAIRQAEDKKAMDILGCKSHYLPFKDCIYRGLRIHQDTDTQWFYTCFEELLGDIHLNDLSLIEEIANYLSTYWVGSNQPEIYAPLGVGNHVDHQLVHCVANLLKQRGSRVKFYADYPYCDPDFSWNRDKINPVPLSQALAQSAKRVSRYHQEQISENNLRARIRGVAAYGSQTPFIFSNWGDMPQIVANYCNSLSPHGPVEQFWF